jgi:hypothetical protein
MEHVVFYPGDQGVPSFQRVASLDEAVSFVEQLRNADNVTEFSVHTLTPVPLAFRAYYHVEVPAASGAPATPPATDGARADDQRADDDRSAEWIAAASVIEPSPNVAAQPTAPPETSPATAEPTPFAVAPPVTEAPQAETDGTNAAGSEVAEADAPLTDPTTPDVIPVASGRRSMGFFAR